MDEPKHRDQTAGILKGLAVLVSLFAPFCALLYAHFSAQESVNRRIDEARGEHRQLVAALQSDLAVLRGELRLLASDVGHRDTLYEKDRVQISTRLASLDSALSDHRKLGIDGLPHPGGVASALKALENQTDDRLRRKDMNAWIELFRARNNSLEIPTLPPSEK